MILDKDEISQNENIKRFVQIKRKYFERDQKLMVML